MMSWEVSVSLLLGSSLQTAPVERIYSVWLQINNIPNIILYNRLFMIRVGFRGTKGHGPIQKSGPLSSQKQCQMVVLYVRTVREFHVIMTAYNALICCFTLLHLIVHLRLRHAHTA